MALIAAHLNAGVISGGDSVAVVYNLPLHHLHTPSPLLLSSLISLMVSVDVKHHVYLLTAALDRVQELCESRGGRPGLAVLMSLIVSVDVKQH